MDFRKIFNKISVKVALVISVLVIALFVGLNFLVVSRGERTFEDVYGVMVQQGNLPDEDMPFMMPSPNQPWPFQRGIEVSALTPREHFKTRFQSSLILIGLATLIGGIGIGFLVSYMISRPLNKLEAGFKKLRRSHYQLKLDENDSEEFNALIKEFNSLATELHRVEELRKNLISDTSHELKTPLASLTAQLEGIDDGVLTLDKDRLKLLRDQVSRLTEMAEGLQDYAQLRSQVIKPQLQNFRLKELMTKIIPTFQKELDDKKIILHLDLPDDYILSADPKLWERVMTNLLDNAIRYSQAANITLSADQNQIVVADDGVGIPAKHQQDIFERFFRLDKSRSRQTGGLGLGLAIVKEIIEAHDWKITARLPQNQKGVEFVISLQ